VTGLPVDAAGWHARAQNCRGHVVAALESADFDRPAAFFFATCQVRAEAALKAEMARRWPGFRFSFSRPGFLTFRLPADHGLALDFDPRLVFARAWGFSLGTVVGSSATARAAELARALAGRRFDALHVWQRDRAPSGDHGFEPHVTPGAREAEAAVRALWPDGGAPGPARIAQAGQSVLDCVLVDPDTWWIGQHVAGAGETRFPGGLREIESPSEAVSRAYVKMKEALAWSGLGVQAGQRIVEIGCAPGGASQALLDEGLNVIGIDPAQVDPCVLAHPRFTHVQKRGSEVRRRELRGVRWLAADMNVAPNYTLDTVEALVTHPTVNVRGLLLTLKLLDWELAEQISEYLHRIRSWGYAQVRAKQLPHNRQEICVAAVKSKSKSRPRQSSA
jgi:23S rRNA (cytidine2498-2'-O)-methyltransferase